MKHSNVDVNWYNLSLRFLKLLDHFHFANHFIFRLRTALFHRIHCISTYSNSSSLPSRKTSRCRNQISFPTALRRWLNQLVVVSLPPTQFAIVASFVLKSSIPLRSWSLLLRISVNARRFRRTGPQNQKWTQLKLHWRAEWNDALCEIKFME